MPTNILNRYLDPEVLGRIANRDLAPRGLVVGNLAGAHKSPLSGFAVEFAGHREYVPGDDTKHIDWRVYYNRERYMIKQYEMETNFVCHLVLDVSASMRYGEGHTQKLLYAARMATMLGYAVINQSDKVSLSTFDDRVRGVVAPSNSMDQIVRMTHHLDELEAKEKTNMGECLNQLAERMKRREIVMIFSDFFGELEGVESAIHRMRYNKHEVVLVQIIHHDELAFELDGMVKFIGLEVPDEYLAQTDDLRRGYLQAVENFNQQLEDISARNGCERILVDTSRDMGEVLIDYMNKRSLLNRGR